MHKQVIVLLFWDTCTKTMAYNLIYFLPDRVLYAARATRPLGPDHVAGSVGAQTSRIKLASVPTVQTATPRDLVPSQAKSSSYFTSPARGTGILYA